MQDAYYLEVSSPGIERKLKKYAHYEKALGEKIYVKTFSPINGEKEFVGKLTAAAEDQITIANEGGEMILPLDKIAKANLSVF